VEDVGTATRFFRDFGLPSVAEDAQRALFVLVSGSTVEILPIGDSSLPKGGVEGAGVHEIVWGVDTAAALAALVVSLSSDHDVKIDPDGACHFVPDFGVPMALALWDKKRVVNAPDPVNAPDVVNRLNTHRKWRRKAQPKVINHAVFRTVSYQRAAAFMCDRLGFRVSDVQEHCGLYLRADGSNNHHNFLLLNANAPLPGCDGRTRFDHANFGVEDIDELMIGANIMERQGWEVSHIGLGRHRIDSGLFYYLPCPAGGEAEYGADADYVDDGWTPRHFPEPLFGYAQFTHNIPPFLRQPPEWKFSYLTDEQIRTRSFLTAI
jgi:catechol 2,3-dioxygenase-like lactoylglutathione lyase family enzyme